jgi:hypothetical protein
MTIQNISNVNLENVLNLKNVYDIRKGVYYRWGMSYFFSWQTKVINPYLIAFFHSNDNRNLKWVYIFFQFWLYVLTGHKIVLFTLVIIIIVLMMTEVLENIMSFFSKGILLLVVGSVIEILMRGNSIIIDYVIRRVFFIPSLLNYYYYDYFNSRDFQWWKYTFIGRILNVNTDFKVLPSFIIGEKYFNNINNNAVTGFLGSEYMNGGFFGMLMSVLIIIIILKTFDYLSYKVGLKITLLTVFTPLYTIWNSSLSTALITGGIMLSVLLLATTSKNIKPSNSINYSLIKTEEK